MGQKINATALRLGSRISWKSSWHTDSKNFPTTLFKDLETRFYNDILFKHFCLNFNNMILSQWQGKTLLSGKLLSVPDFLPQVKKLNYLSPAHRKMISDNFSQGLHYMSPVYQDISYSLNGQKDFYYDLTKKKEYPASDNNIKGFWPIVSSQSLADLIGSQMLLPTRLRDNNFKRSLRKGVVGLARIFFNKKGVYFLSGIRVICSGRWQKTKSSRKQKLVYSFGKLKRQTFSNFLDYGFTSVTTKYGSCGIKVWISYKKH